MRLDLSERLRFADDLTAGLEGRGLQKQASRPDVGDEVLSPDGTKTGTIQQVRGDIAQVVWDDGSPSSQHPVKQLEPTGISERASLRKCVASVQGELRDFTHIAGDRYAFTPAATEKVGEYPWDQGGIWKLVGSPDGRKVIVREDRFDEAREAGLLNEPSVEVPSHLYSLLTRQGLRAEPPEHTIPPEVARDKLIELQEKAKTRELSQQETELRSMLEKALTEKSLFD